MSPQNMFWTLCLLERKFKGYLNEISLDPFLNDFHYLKLHRLIRKSDFDCNIRISYFLMDYSCTQPTKVPKNCAATILLFQYHQFDALEVIIAL
jgi:hypothetical protein